VVSGVITRLIRPSDLISRLGGDEFAILLPETDSESAKILVDRIRTNTQKELDEKKWPVTLNMGVITYRKFDCSIDEMINQVDKLMYQIKKSGKNGVLYKIYSENRSKQ
jgi:diguanylate cyclase (GGDEF)-like protein